VVLLSLIFATAITFCVLARRMRVLASAVPDRAVKCMVHTPGLGLPSARMSTDTT
jgi:hypothetical protein